MRKTCGNCQYFGKEPNTPSRGCCWYSAEFEYYAVVGAHEKGCDDWVERKETNWDRCFGTPEKAALTAQKIAFACCECGSSGKGYACDNCPINGYCGGVPLIAEWLEREDA